MESSDINKENIKNNNNNKSSAICYYLKVLPINISKALERFFYQLGLQIAIYPGRWLTGSTLIVLICLIGLINFRQEKNPLKLWVPPNSDFLRDTEWLMNEFGEGMRVQTLIMTGENILEPNALLKLNDATERILKTGMNTSWEDVCFRVPVIPGRTKREIFLNHDDKESEEFEIANNYDYVSLVHSSLYCAIYNGLKRNCYITSILDIWKNDINIIKNLTKEDILNDINTVKISPTSGHNMNYIKLLGDIKKDDNGMIVEAKAVKTQWFLNVNFSQIDMNKIGNDVGTADWATETVLNWEAEFLKTAKNIADQLSNYSNNNQSNNLAFWYEAGRSFGDVSSSTMFQDISKIAIGILLMSIYVQILLSKFNWIEWRFCLTSAGLICVGGAFIIAVGICSLIGVPYGPVHTSLPFMLMGLGVDDIFVMMAAWDQVHSEEMNRLYSLEKRIALMLSHAGPSIFVTSLTDAVAFVISASTILPSLQSFCIYAAVGVFVTFLLQVTFFVAFFTFDTKRVEANRNGIVPCIVHSGNERSLRNEERFSWRLTGFLYSRYFLTKSGKLSIIFITLVIGTLGIYGSVNLEQRFDPEWFIPEDTYLANYLKISRNYYPKEGYEGSIFIGKINYVENFEKILKLSKKLNHLNILEDVDQWPVYFKRFVKRNYNEDILNVTSDTFNDYLSQFLFSQSGGKYQKNFRFDNKNNFECGKPIPTIKVSSLDYKFKKFQNPKEWINGMNLMKEMCKNSKINGFVTSWSKIYANWVTDEVISEEVTRNLILALICVMGTTAILIAELQTCFWIFICILLTLIDVCGFMYYWNLTIDIVSCIGLELAVGLSVDYAAHVAHAFLNSNIKDEEGDKTLRTLGAVKHIGAAVVYGAGSTLLALSLLATSEAYVFRSFFKIFFLVVLLGLWHGLIFLPVILSTVGPQALKQRDNSKNIKRPFNSDHKNQIQNKESVTAEIIPETEISEIELTLPLNK